MSNSNSSSAAGDQNPASPSNAVVMLVNANHDDELRIALVENFKLVDLDTELASSNRTKGNIYKAKIVRVEPSLEAVFVDYGASRHGFLPIKEIAPRYLKVNPDLPASEQQKVSAADALKAGQEILVQVEKEERGSKGAALTTFVSLAGSYVVAMPDNPSAGGISRRIAGNDRDMIKDKLSRLNAPEGVGVIIRTAGINREVSELQWDLDSLMAHWEEIMGAYAHATAPKLIHADSDVIYRAVRDNLHSDVSKIIVDNTELYDKLHNYLAMAKPHFLHCLEHHKHKVPLFTHYQIENQVEAMYQHTIELPSGGSIVIDYTEALTSIDVNSSKATKGQDIEETALLTNLEAVDEVARQLRLRDIGGLIVIDTIDMAENNNREKVEQRLKRAVSRDRARIQILPISKLGLMEMSRQRLDSSINISQHVRCPHCEGQGVIRSIDSFTASLLRVIEHNATNSQAPNLVLQLPADVATYLLNEKREIIKQIETDQETKIMIVPNPNLSIPQYDLTRLREGQKMPNSFELVGSSDSKTVIEFPEISGTDKKKMTPMVGSTTVRADHPYSAKAKRQFILMRLLSFLSRLLGISSGGKKPTKKPARSNRNQRNRRGGNRRPNQQQNRNQRNRGGSGRSGRGGNNSGENSGNEGRNGNSGEGRSSGRGGNRSRNRSRNRNTSSQSESNKKVVDNLTKYDKDERL